NVATTATASQIHGVSAGAEASSPLAYRRHTARPSAIPSGAPIASAVRAITDACQPTVACSCCSGERDAAEHGDEQGEAEHGTPATADIGPQPVQDNTAHALSV
ncbi:MAG TPA: hypothetical protein VNO51_24025, partial [Ilumatobacteraceae bacterium]|nr:hypothetical protein [Ilumatobacteraceae bacterium]